jgi:ABC-2 type transport system permease protein
MSALFDHADPRSARLASLASAPFDIVGARGRGFRDIVASARGIVRRRELLALLVRRDLKARYKDSALGFVWSLLKPLVQFAIYFFVVGQIIGVARGIPDFAIFVFAGLTIFGLFSEIVSGGTASILNNSGLIKKVHLPREIFPLASVGSGLFNFLIQLAVLLVAAVVLSSIHWGWHLLYAPAAVVVMVLYGTAAGLLLAALNVYLRDIQYLIELALMVLLWASPIIYPWSMVRDLLGPSVLLTLYTDNPLTLAVLAFQRAMRSPDVAASYPPDLALKLAIAAGIGVIAVLLAQRVFARLEGNFAQEL